MDQFDIERNGSDDKAQDEMLASLLKRIGGSGGADRDGGGSEQSDPLGGVLSALLSNPEMIKMLPTVIASVKPMLEMLGGGAASSASGEATVAKAVDKSLKPSEHGREGSVGNDSRTALLCAMKPYLSEERRNAVDHIVKLSRLGEILKTL